MVGLLWWRCCGGERCWGEKVRTGMSGMVCGRGGRRSLHGEVSLNEPDQVIYRGPSSACGCHDQKK